MTEIDTTEKSQPASLVSDDTAGTTTLTCKNDQTEVRQVFQDLKSDINKGLTQLQNKSPKEVIETLRPPASELARQVRPFIIWGLFLVPILAIPMMTWDWVKRVILKKDDILQIDNLPEGSIRLRQNLSPHKDNQESNFFFSPAFAVTTAAIFISGLPAAIAYGLYTIFGVDAVFGNPSKDPNFVVTFIVIGLYITGLAWCLMPLFFRAWFTFPLQNGSAEWDVIIDESKIRKTNVKGWAADVFLLGFSKYFPKETAWKDVACIQYEHAGFGRMSPLSDTLFSKDSLMYQALERMAKLIDAVVDKLGRAEYLIIKTKYEKSYVGGIKIRLWELTGEERAKLFYAIRKWAPWAELSPTVQQELVGSTVLSDPRYTQIWFDLLMANAEHQNATTLEPGHALQSGNFTVTEKLGTGGQAVAYLAQAKDNTQVVLKEFVLATGDGIEALVASASDFENESSLLSQISHPNIVKMQEIFMEDNRAYLVLEHVTGQTLRAFVKEHGPLSESKVIGMAAQMCDVLTYLHSMVPAIVHRDFTPDNLLLQDDGSIKLIDFSIAQNKHTRGTDEGAGKHSYTSPEQFRGEACPQSDIYALGATLYYLLVGSDPVPISKSDPRDKNADISEKIAVVVAKATELQLSDRYETAEWVKLDLETGAQASSLQSEIAIH